MIVFRYNNGVVLFFVLIYHGHRMLCLMLVLCNIVYGQQENMAGLSARPPPVYEKLFSLSLQTFVSINKTYYYVVGLKYLKER